MTELVCVRSYRTRAEAELARATLEAGGINATVRADDAGGTEPALVLTTGGARVLVALADAARARVCIGVQTSSQKNS
jgi:archaeosine-15-forming tRNA-guanine transglycosylase